MNSILQFISSQAIGVAGALMVLSLYIVGARIDMPSETDALRRSAAASNTLAAEYAAQHAIVAKKDRL
jgi:hypothetical protein